MRSLFLRCLRELLWRWLHPRCAARARADADALLAARSACPPARLAELYAFPWWVVRNTAVKLDALAPCPGTVDRMCALLRARADVGIVRRNAASALAGLDTSPESADVLRACARDPYWEVRRDALLALVRGAPADATTLETLRAAARRERSFEVRMALARALGATRSPEALPLLETLSRDDSWLVRLQAAVALTELGVALPARREHVRALLARMERSSAGLTGRLVLDERFAAIQGLIAGAAWPDAPALAPLYLAPDVPWTRQ
jgi:hypothetical protein